MTNLNTLIELIELNRNPVTGDLYTTKRKAEILQHLIDTQEKKAYDAGYAAAMKEMEEKKIDLVTLKF